MYYFFSNLLSPFINFSNLIIIIILVFIFLKKFNRYFYFLAFFFAFISILPVGKFLEYHLLSKKYFSNKNINGYDAIIVLGGYDKRIYHAITLHKKNKNSKLIFLGGTRYLFADKNQRLLQSSKLARWRGTRAAHWIYIYIYICDIMHICAP